MKLIKLCVFFILYFSLKIYSQNPGGVSGASLWYKSNLGVTNSSGVSQWNDQSGNARNLTQTTATARPVYNTSNNLINFNPSVGFDGSNDVLRTVALDKSDIISGSGPFTASTYIVYRAKNNSALLYTHSNGSGGTWNIGATTNFSLLSNRGSNVTPAVANQVRMQSLQGISNGAADSRLNGTTTSTTWSSSVNTSVNTSDPFWLGAQGTSAFGNTEIAEFISFPNNSNSNNERQRVESYLGLKYGITLPFNYLASDATVLWNRTTNNTYNNNIVGIGKDIASGLEQKQSQSINNGNQIIISSGSLATTNSDNSNAIASDLQFLIIGDNGLNGYEFFSDTFGNSAVFSRSSKVWFAENTGNYSQATSIYIPEYMHNGPSSPLLILSTTSDFASTTSSSTNTYITAETNTVVVNGSTYYEFKLTDAQVGNDFYFALANGIAPGGVSSGLKIWHKADYGNTFSTGVKVSASTNIADFTQAINNGTAAQTPDLIQGSSLKYNFNSYFNFTGGSNYFAQHVTTDNAGYFGPQGTQSLHSFIATIPESYFGFLQINSNTAAGGNLYDSPQFYNNGLYNQPFVTNPVLAYTLNERTLNNVLSFSMKENNGVGNDVSNVKQNAISLGTNSTTNITVGGKGYLIGADLAFGGDDNIALNSSISEIIAYNNVLSSTDELKVQSYLALKTGVTLGNTTSVSNYLNSSGNIIWTGDATFQNNIAGIGRDDLSGLLQKQSRSSLSGNQIIISNGVIASNNNSNTSSFDINKQFLIWGDNNLPGYMAFSDEFGDNTIISRANRVWFAHNSGTYSKDSRIYMPTNLYNGVGSPKLIVSSTSNFSSTASSTTNTYILAETSLVTIDGISYYEYRLSAAQVANDFYFTLSNGITPGGVSGARLWIRGDKGVTGGATVSEWKDWSTNGFDFKASTTFRPNGTSTFKNFNQVVKFNGSNNVMFYDGLPNILPISQILDDAKGETYFIFADGNANPVFVNQQEDGTGSRVMPNLFSNGSFGRSYGLCSTCFNVVNSTNSDQGQIVNQIRNGLNIKLLKNNVEYQTATLNASLNNITSLQNRAVLGGRFQSSLQQYSNAALGELIIFDKVLTVEEYNKVNSYLAIKYGTTLGSTSNLIDYKDTFGNTIWTGNSTYQNNIVGIGRDDITGLYQKQSQSANTGDQIVISNGAIATTNDLNSNTFTNDKQFLIVGENNLTGTMAFTDAFGDASVFSRTNKIWFVDNSGSYNEATRIYVPINFYNGVGSPKMIVSTTNNFASTVSSTTNTYITAESATVTVNGASYYEFKLTAAQVANDFYFALANGVVPGGVSGARIWLRSDIGTSTTTSGGAIQQWNDLSGNGNHVVQATLSNRPIYSTTTFDAINYNPSVVFNGSKIMGDADGILTATTKTNAIVFAVNSNTSLTSSYVLNGNSLNLHAPFSDTNIYWDGNGRITNAWGGVLGIPNIWTGYNTSTANPNRREIRRDGLILKSDATATSFTPANSAFNIGGNGYNGNINEILVYDINLSTTERNKIESYLAIKNGITLNQSTAQNYVASDGTIIWNGTSSAAYKNNIAGIGRDDVSALIQKQSKSVNSDEQIIMSNGTFAADNTLNNSTFSADKQFLVWGDNNQSGTTALHDVNIGKPLMRTNQAWFVDNTNGYNKSTEVYFPITFKVGTVDPYLIYSTSSTFTSGTNTLISFTKVEIAGITYYKTTLSEAQVGTDFYLSLAEDDTDSDGYVNSIDLDDDNDGILDIDELIIPTLINEDFSTTLCNGFDTDYFTCSNGGAQYATIANQGAGYYPPVGASNSAGKFLSVNGATNTTAAIWKKTVTVFPNTEYSFSMFGGASGPLDSAGVFVKINGNTIGVNDFNEVWTKYTTNFNSGSNTSITISLTSLYTEAGGNDFGLDDLELTQLVTTDVNDVTFIEENDLDKDV